MKRNAGPQAIEIKTREVKTREVKTREVNLVYEESGPKGGEILLLLHGWPDSPRTWDRVLPILHTAGYRTVVPYLRGYGKSTFRDPLFGRQRRTGQPVAFAGDMLQLADRLRLQRFAFIGHDWGARTGYALAALAPERLKSLVVISVPYQPGEASPPSFPQAQAYWYQWLLCTKPGEQKLRKDTVAFGRAQWDAWSPAGWYTEEQFQEAARSWTGKDFPDVVLHSYRSRWGHAEMDPRYARQQARFEAAKTLSTPTLLIHGQADRCLLAESTDGAAVYFRGSYKRALLEGVGHFCQRENPEATASLILEHLRQHP